MKSTRVLFVGGGSVGHIAPSLAVWGALQKKMKNVEAHFVCSPRLGDLNFLEKNDCPHSILHAPRLSFAFPFQWIKSMKEARNILDNTQPDIIFSKGGYISVPLCRAAHKRGIPIVLHESDAVSGFANRVVSRWTERICLGFPSHKTERDFTGNPVRSNIPNGSRTRGLERIGLKGDRPILLVMGGSQGALALNHIVTSVLDDLLLRCDVLHITGKGKTLKEPRDGYAVFEFVDEELPDFYACADLALSRAGAGSIAELAACGIPTMLVPLRGVGHDHQRINALEAEKSGGCVHLDQEELNETLLPTIHMFVSDKKKREGMAKKMASLHTPDAAVRIAEIIVDTLASHGRDQ